MAKITEVCEVTRSKLKPYERNAKIHSDEQVQKIADSINEFGFVSPCLIDRDYNIIAGHGRVMAAELLGMETVPCVFIEGLTDEQRRAYILADNRLTELGEWDMGLVNFELRNLGDFDVEVTGFELPDDWFSRADRWDDSREEGNEEYNEFLEKFEIKKTTDDCYTPDNIYETVAEWVETEYGVDKSRFVRPFYPDGNYQTEHYPDGCVVVDNPPFSILAEILRFYVEKGIKFFLFAPTLTLFSGRGLDICYLAVGATLTYENGAKVNTSFITNMEDGFRLKTAPGLYKAIKDADEENRRNSRNELPSYEFPPEVVTAASISRYSVHGVDFYLKANECERISTLDAMKEHDRGIYGGAFLISEDATKRRVDAQREKDRRAREAEIERLNKAVEGIEVTEEGTVVWQLSEREVEIVKSLGGKA